MLNIYINTWGNYNENGADGGKWVTLPMDFEELENIMEEVAENMGDNDPEWFVNDYEWTCDYEPFEVCEMDNFEELNERVETLARFDDYESKALAAIIDSTGYGFKECLDILERGTYVFYCDMDLTEVAEELVNECYFTKDTPDIFTRYFDYESFGRDLGFDGYTETEWGVIYIE